MISKAQIVATIGPSSCTHEKLVAMMKHQMDVARLNFSWGTLETHAEYIALIRKASSEVNKKIPIIIDLPGPRIQQTSGHTYDQNLLVLTEKDAEYISFGVSQGVEYFAMSFVGTAEDINKCKEIIKKTGGNQKIIGKIERKIALDNLESIIEASDAIMVARGDLGNEIPLEQIPFAQARIIAESKKAGKPVITATQMMLSMTKSPIPTRAEVTDVANAILQGSDAVMFSEETANGDYPIEAVQMMEKIVLEAEKHVASSNIHPL